MPNSEASSSGLTIEGCRLRQNRLRDRLRVLGLDAAAIVDPRHVDYLGQTFRRGFGWNRSIILRHKDLSV